MGPEPTHFAPCGATLGGVDFRDFCTIVVATDRRVTFRHRLRKDRMASSRRKNTAGNNFSETGLNAGSTRRSWGQVFFASNRDQHAPALRWLTCLLPRARPLACMNFSVLAWRVATLRRIFFAKSMVQRLSVGSQPIQASAKDMDNGPQIVHHFLFWRQRFLVQDD